MRVAVFGAGIAGLTVANELADAALDVVVYDPTAPVEALGRWTAIGGKARSQYFQLPETGTSFLPGEHGFRFFPSFYANTFDTLERIPIPWVDGARECGSVFDRLTPARNWGAAYADGRLVSLPRRRPRNHTDLMRVVRFLLGPRFSAADMAILAAGLGRAIALYGRGRDDELDQVSFWELMQADRLSVRTQRFLQTMPRALVAMDPRRGSARTLLTTLTRLLADLGRDAPGDFVFTGPTSEAWFQPWFEHLEAKGVQFVLGPGRRLSALQVEQGQLEAARLADGTRVRADHFVLAVPLRNARDLLDASCEGNHALWRLDVGASEGWMIGAQAFFERMHARFDGHLVFPDAPWCVSAIAQHGFWSPSPAHFRHVYGAGRFSGVLSLIFGAEDCAGLCGFPALGATTGHVFSELERVLSHAPTAAGTNWLRSGETLSWHLDDDVAVDGSTQTVVQQISPLLIHPPAMYAKRPGADSGVRGLSLAGEYLRTSVDLATMEGANESGRMAARHVLETLGLSPQRVALFEHRSPLDGLQRLLRGRVQPLSSRKTRRPAGVLTRSTRSLPRAASIRGAVSHDEFAW